MNSCYKQIDSVLYLSVHEAYNKAYNGNQAFHLGLHARGFMVIELDERLEII